MKLMKTICIANQKGGVGKTTTAINLGHGLAQHGKLVLLVDCDPQGQVATFLSMRQESGLFNLLIGGRPLANVIRSTNANSHERPGLQVIPGDKRTATAQIVLAAEGFKLECLNGALKRAQVDYVIFDTSPSVGLLQEAALYAADWLVIPCACDYASTEGLAGVMDTLAAVNREQGAKCKLLGVLPTFFDEVTRESAAILEQLMELGEAAWPPIHRATILREATAEGLTIFEKSPRSRAALEYAGLAMRILSYG